MKTATTFNFTENSRFYSKENEASFTIPIKRFVKLTVNLSVGGRLKILEVETIAQKWFGEDSKGYMKNRLRKTQRSDNTSPNYTLDTKFELKTTLSDGVEKHVRYEFNNALSAEEYTILMGKYYDLPTVNKNRFTVRDTQTNFEYIIDIYPNDNEARVEIEFTNLDDLFKWSKPDWAQDNFD